MRLSEFEGIKALEVMADILEPAVAISQNPKVIEVFQNHNSRVECVQVILRETPEEIIKIMAILDDEDPETYKVNLFTLPAKLLEIFNDPSMTDLFLWQAPATDKPSSGPATENIEVN